jgi:putative transcriptional regulator
MVISLIGHYIKQSPYDRNYICEYMGVSQNTLSNWCTGKTYPSIPQLFKLANLLGVTINELYEYREEKE